MRIRGTFNIGRRVLFPIHRDKSLFHGPSVGPLIVISVAVGGSSVAVGCTSVAVGGTSVGGTAVGASVGGTQNVMMAFFGNVHEQRMSAANDE